MNRAQRQPPRMTVYWTLEVTRASISQTIVTLSASSARSQWITGAQQNERNARASQIFLKENVKEYAIVIIFLYSNLSVVGASQIYSGFQLSLDSGNRRFGRRFCRICPESRDLRHNVDILGSSVNQMIPQSISVSTPENRVCAIQVISYLQQYFLASSELCLGPSELHMPG